MARKLALPVLICILILAALLRIWGIGWGLPTSDHYFSYHPDETTILFAALNVNLFSGELNPGFYNYGSLFIYMTNIATVIGTMVGEISLAQDDVFAKIGEFAKLYMAGRIVAVILGILTVYLVYALGRRAYGRKTGILAALMMAVLPIHAMHSKFMAVDVPATFFVVLALIFAVRLTDGHKLRDYVFAGLFAGLAAGTKYNAGLVLLSPIVAHFATCQASAVRRILSPLLVAMIAGAAAGFLIGTPGALLYPSQFARDFGYELRHAQTGHGLLFSDTGSGYIYHITHSLWPAMGIPLLILAGIGLLYALKRRTPGDLVLLVFLIAYYGVIGAAQIRFARYTIPLLPVLVLLAARVSADLVGRCFAGRRIARSFGYIAVAVLVVVIAYTATYSLAIDRMFSSVDTRDQAVRWIRHSIPQGSTIGLPTIPWFYTPPLDPYFGMVNPKDRYERVVQFAEYDLVVSQDNEWDAGFLQREAPQYVMMSEFEYEDRLRMHDPAAEAYFALIRRDYRLIRQFSDGPTLFGWRLPFIPELPHDMSYVSPTIRIYERKAG